MRKKDKIKDTEIVEESFDEMMDKTMIQEFIGNIKKLTDVKKSIEKSLSKQIYVNKNRIDINIKFKETTGKPFVGFYKQETCRGIFFNLNFEELQQMFDWLKSIGVVK